MISWIIVSHVEPHRRAALGNRGNRGTEGLEVFSKEKPFREVSCDFVEGFLGYVCGFVDGGSEKRRRYLSAAPSLIFNFQLSIRFLASGVKNRHASEEEQTAANWCVGVLVEVQAMCGWQGWDGSPFRAAASVAVNRIVRKEAVTLCACADSSE
ncbi:MAG: hypothetical protein II221_03755 [Paludibacteraceae bacterium]|nr:hypothetical protein [Paludibacteraceae bacterium]